MLEMLQLWCTQECSAVSDQESPRRTAGSLGRVLQRRAADSPRDSLWWWCKSICHHVCISAWKVGKFQRRSEYHSRGNL